MLRKTVDAVGLMVIINSAILCVLCFVACDALAVAATSTATAAKKNEYCSPSSCGNIKNIHYPFRLKGDPRINCGDPHYELACENNRTVLYLHQGRYYVEEVSYENRTIRVVDSGLQDDNCSSMPRYSLSRFNFSDGGEPYEFAFDQRNWNYWFQVAHLSCEAPVRRVGCGRDHSSSDEYCVLDMSPCINGSVDSSIASWQKHYSYALVGHSFRIWEIPDSCGVNLFVPVVLDDLSTNRELIALEKLENFSFHYIHHRMAMGFPLWFQMDCSDCDATGGYCDMSGVSDKSNPNCIYFGCISALQSFSCA
ncbi:PREDICTED: uncharacterized protein LOC109114236 [Nelumbo nucifera]|uniref:Uncharacterized protein LOC109114236 n=1 Tax=Nelumbo nucifera TaxID=4432 RepID=A0A1U8PZY4_NELNU|nr:PREDICTED: uncharacterized protein LOC109114236 [Nelumbo nucifera]